MHLPLPTLLALLTTLTTTSAQQGCVQGEGLFNVPSRGKVVFKEFWPRSPKTSDPNYEDFRKGKDIVFRKDSHGICRPKARM